MFRVFDPKEKLIFKKYREPYSTTPDPWLDQLVDLPASGVYQIRVTSGNSRSGSAVSSVGVTLSRSLHWGVSFQNGTYSAWGDPRAKLYARVPPHAETFRLGFVTGANITIKNGAAIKLAASPPPKGTIEVKQVTELKTEAGTAVWTFNFSPTSTPESWSFRAADFPLILCPTEEAATKIGASVEVTPDGTVLCHKFQRKILEALPKLLTPKNVGDVESDHMVKRLIDTKSQWLSDPERNGWLLHPFSGFRRVDPALRYQNVDPTSHWAGAMGTGDSNTKWWKWRLEQKTPPGNRWDRLKSIATSIVEGKVVVDGPWAGTSLREYGETVALALAATINGSFNPYYGDTKLFNRAAAASLSDLLVLGEDEIWRGTDPENADLDPYPGNSAFAIGQKTLEAFSLVAPRMTPELAELRSLWTEGLQRLLDRQFPMYLTSARNQSSHFLTAFQQFAKGTGKPKDARDAQLFAARFIQELSPPGYPMESEGPDPSYAGLSHYHMAVYAREANSQTMLDAIRKSYRFFNHTVAPEPDGRSMLGACNFGHRIARSFVDEQWMGARGITSDIPEVGLWPISSGGVTDARLNDTASQEAFATARYLYYRQPNTSGILPAKESGSFTRNFGDELIAVKRPFYYAAVFVGKGGFQPKKLDFQKPESAGESTGGIVSERTITPYLGGGLSLVWTPAYGTSLLATNWAPTTHHGLVATELVKNSDGTSEVHRYWEDDAATQFQLDNNVLKITGKIEKLPINYTRLYAFRDNEIVVSLRLTATESTASNKVLTKLVEILPFAAGQEAKPNTQIHVPGESGGKAVTKSLKVVNSKNSGMEVLFDEPVTVNVQRNGLKLDKLQINRVEIVLPTNLQKGDTVILNYRLRPTEAQATNDTVPTLTATPANGAVTLNWTPVSGATGYNIKRGLISGQPAQIADARVQGTSYVDSSLVNGTTYYYWVSASGPWGIGVDSKEASAKPVALPELKSAASRKTHGTVDYAIPIFDSTDASPKVPVECRSGNTLKLVATFSKPVSDGKATITLGKARLNGIPTFAGNTMTINLNDVSVHQTLQIVLTNVRATDGTVLAKAALPSMLILTGDVTGDGKVNADDTAAWQSASGSFAGSPGFKPRADITCNGAIDLADAVRIRENYTPPSPSSTPTPTPTVSPAD